MIVPRGPGNHLIVSDAHGSVFVSGLFCNLL